MTTGGRILALEDEARNSALLQAILVRVGYDLTIAATLAEARAWLRDNRPGLVLLDHHLRTATASTSPARSRPMQRRRTCPSCS